MPVSRDSAARAGSRLEGCRAWPISCLILSLAIALVGCAGVYRIPTGSPQKDLLGAFEPGRTTRAEVRARLGDPLYEAKYTASSWNAEVYWGQDVYQEIVAIGMPIPAGQRSELAPLLAIYDTDGVLRSIEYFGSQGQGARGDLSGHTMRGVNTVLGPPMGTVNTREWHPVAGECLIVVAIDPMYRHAGIYLDSHYLTTAVGPSFLRVEVEPGNHTLACRQKQDSSYRTDFQTPGHLMPTGEGWMTSIAAVDLECPADGTRYVRLRPGAGWYGYCAADSITEPPVIENARELAIPIPAGGEDPIK